MTANKLKLNGVKTDYCVWNKGQNQSSSNNVTLDRWGESCCVNLGTALDSLLNMDGHI